MRIWIGDIIKITLTIKCLPFFLAPYHTKENTCTLTRHTKLDQWVERRAGLTAVNGAGKQKMGYFSFTPEQSGTGTSAPATSEEDLWKLCLYWIRGHWSAHNLHLITTTKESCFVNMFFGAWWKFCPVSVNSGCQLWESTFVERILPNNCLSRQKKWKEQRIK